MAINLLGNLNNIQSNQANTQTSTQVESAGSLMRQAATAYLNELRGMMPGDTLSGQLVSKDGNSIGLLLNNNTLLNTVLDNDVNIAMGQQITFEVRSSQNGQLTLRPMFTNLSNSSTIMNALNAANIGASDASIEMVDTLMQNSMSIGKDMLSAINRELTRYPDADIKDIVMLHKMDIPVTADTVNQMHLYNNNNQWMMENLNNLAEDLTNMLTENLSYGGAKTDKLLQGLADIFKPSDEPASENISENTSDQTKLTSNPELETAGNKINPDENIAINKFNVFDRLAALIKEEPSELATSDQITSPELKDQLSDPVLKEGLSESSFNQNVSDSASKGHLSPPELSGELSDQSLKGDTAALALKGKLSDPAVRELIKNSITELLKDTFLMNPKSVGEDKYVKKYYERTLELSENLSRLMAENGKSDTSFARSLGGVKENINFMNQINELYNYVQLPLKMNDSQANGDLYVYARKKGRGTGGEDGKLTALLHLSMEHLGTMDVFLTLQDGNKLSTKFCLEDESMIDFIASHIDELNSRLTAKGYDIGTTVATKSDGIKNNVIENITAGDGGSILLSTQSFDARA